MNRQSHERKEAEYTEYQKYYFHSMLRVASQVPQQVRGSSKQSVCSTLEVDGRESDTCAGDRESTVKVRVFLYAYNEWSPKRNHQERAGQKVVPGRTRGGTVDTPLADVISPAHRFTLCTDYAKLAD
ncbi:hypothetical protein CBL_14060 [Carabus blaptoides fortunei]